MLTIFNKFSNPLLFLFIGIGARLLPHPPNFTPITAMALFGGVYLSRKSSLVYPLIVMLISDFFIGFGSLETRMSVYGSFLLIGGLGWWLKEHRSIINIITATLLSSFLFFLITNASVWLFWSMYPKNLSGLMESYLMALPFFRNMVLGDIIYTTMFFTSYELVLRGLKKKKFVPSLLKLQNR